MWRNPDFIAKEEVGVPAHLGTACHQLFQTHVSQNIPLSDEDIVKSAQRNNVEVDGYNGLKWRALKMQTAYKKILEAGYFQVPKAEEKSEISLSNGYQYTTYTDLYELHAPWAAVMELKTGKVDTGWEYQARDGALAIFKKYKELGLEYVYAIVFAPVIDYYNVKKFEAAELIELEKRIVSNMEKVGQHYVTGSACPYCDNLRNCKAIKNQIDPMTRDIMKAGGPQNITGAEIAKWRPIMKSMKKIIDTFEDAEKMILEQAGTIDLGNGTELYLREQYNKKIDAGEAIGVLCDKFGVEKSDFIKKITIKNKDIEALSAMTAPVGGKSKQIKAVWLTMEQDGAMVKELKKVKATRPISKKVGDKNG